MNISKHHQGFTLIELVVVIVLLGILAVTAAPKFIDLQSDAKTATLQAIKGSMQSASSLVRGKSLIQGNEGLNHDDTPTPTVTVNGVSVNVSLGYPRSNDEDEWTGNLLDIDTSEFTVAVVAGSIVISPAGSATVPIAIPASPYAATTAANCYTFYTEASDATTPATTQPLIVTVDCL